MAAITEVVRPEDDFTRVPGQLEGQSSCCCVGCSLPFCCFGGSLPFCQCDDGLPTCCWFVNSFCIRMLCFQLSCAWPFVGMILGCTGGGFLGVLVGYEGLLGGLIGFLWGILFLIVSFVAICLPPPPEMYIRSAVGFGLSRIRMLWVCLTSIELPTCTSLRARAVEDATSDKPNEP